MASGYPNAPPPPYAPTSESYQQNPPNQPPYNSQPYNSQPYPYPPQGNQGYSEPNAGQPYSQPPPQSHPPSEPFGSQPYHYGNADDTSDFNTAGAFTEKSVRAGKTHCIHL